MTAVTTPTTNSLFAIPELIDTIIDYISDDRVALKRCSLVSQAWKPRSYKHLFSEIHLDNGPYSPYSIQPRLLYEILRASPFISNLVSTLYIVSASLPLDVIDDLLSISNQIYEDEATPLILEMLHNVQHLSVGPRMRPYAPVSMNKQLLSALCKMLPSPTLIHIALQNTIFPISLLCNCPQLRSIALHQVDFDTTEVMGRPRFLPNQQLKVETLELSGSASSKVEWLEGQPNAKAILDVSHLRDLTISAPFLSPRGLALSSVLRLAADMLESLRIWAHISDENFPTLCIPDLSRLKHLQKLDLATSVSQDVAEVPISLTWLCLILESVPANNSLEIITFTFAFDSDDRTQPPGSWLAVDQLLTKGSHFRRLTSVIVNINTPNFATSFNRREAEEMMQCYFPTVCATGLLDLRIIRRLRDCS